MPATMRHAASKRTAEEREKTQLHYMSEIHHWATCMDRILFRKNLKLLADFLDEESVAVEFTPAEQKRWKAIVTTALQENKPAALLRHLQAIHKFWQAYREK